MLDFLHVFSADQNIPNFHIHNVYDQPRKNSNVSEDEKVDYESLEQQPTALKNHDSLE